MTRLSLARSALLAATSFISVSRPLYSQCEAAELLSFDDQFAMQAGQSLGISGEFAIVGVTPRSGDDGIGYAIVYRRQSDSWKQIAKLEAAPAAGISRFADAVAIDGRLAVIAGVRPGQPGIAVVFEWDGNAWQETTRLSASAATPSYGASVDIAGNRIIVGDPIAASAFVFEWDGSQWHEAGTLVPDTPTFFGFRFGHSVSIESEFAVVGAPFDPTFGPDAGLAFLYRRRDNGWQFESELVPAGLVAGAKFGISVSTSAGRALVGAPGLKSAHLFEWDGTAWSEATTFHSHPTGINTQFGSSVAIEADSCVVGAIEDREGSFRSGTMYRFRRVLVQWAEVARVTSSDGGTTDHLGHAVALSGDFALAGAPLHGHPGAESGAAYVYTFEPGAAGEWHNYGTGWPGTLGVPDLTLLGNPVLCESPTIVIGNARGIPTVGLALIGVAPASEPTGLGGTLLVRPQMFAVLGIPGAGLDLTTVLPCDPTLAGFIGYLQVLERDPGASQGVAFTPGLEIQLGLCP